MRCRETGYSFDKTLQIVYTVRRITDDLPAKLPTYLSQGTRIRISENDNVLGLKCHDEIRFIAS
jgi:hypothetical protein